MAGLVGGGWFGESSGADEYCGGAGEGVVAVGDAVGEGVDAGGVLGRDEVDELRRRGLIDATLQKSMFQTEMKRWKINA